MGREDDRVRQPRLAGARRRIRFGVRDLGWRLRPQRRPRRVLFLLGAQRSGTSMLLDAFAADHRVKVYDEHSPLNLRRPRGSRGHWWDPRHTRRYRGRMLPLPEVARRIGRSAPPFVVSKPLLESQQATALLDTVPGSRAVWLVRRYQDVAVSNIRKFGAGVNQTNLRPIAERTPGDWRSEAATPEVVDLVARELDEDLPPADGGALFWYARNRLFFDLGLDRDPRVLLVAYEDLVADPREWMRRIYAHAGVEADDVGAHDIHQRSVGRAREVTLRASVEEACRDLEARFREARSQQAAGHRTDDRVVGGAGEA